MANTKKRTNVSSRAASAKKRTKSSSVGKGNIFNRRSWLIVAVLAVVGAFLIFRASAATTNFEAESTTKAGGVTVANDATASGGKYAQFSTAGNVVSSSARFPGDPNPRVSGKRYIGTSLGRNGSMVDPKAIYETPTGVTLPLHRIFNSNWGGRNGTVDSWVKPALAKGRLPFVSFKPAGGVGGWANMGSGKHDAEIDDLLRRLDNAGGPVWLAIHHEPENDGGNPANWRAMQQRVRQRMDAVGTKNVTFVPVLMACTWGNVCGGRNPNDWWVAGNKAGGSVWDAYFVDYYTVGAGSVPQTGKAWASFIPWVEAKNMPFGIAEWGNVDEPKATQGTELRNFWNWMNSSGKDIIAFTNWDSDGSGTKYMTTGSQLDTFREINKNDSRVFRYTDAPTGVSNFGTMTANVSVPENGTYRVWARLQPTDTTNNALQVQVDNGSPFRLENNSIPANQWTWVGIKDNNANSPASVVLTAGSRKVTLTGIEKGVKVDRVLITNETCTPTGTGDNCATITADTIAPTATITSPANGATVSGKIVVRVSASDNVGVDSVNFKVDNKWQVADTTAPYEWTMDTSKFTNGSHTILARVRDAVGNLTERSVTINVTSGSTTSPTPPADTQAPSAPKDLRAALNLDWTELRYKMGLSWTASIDNVDVTSYSVSRNNSSVGNTSDVSLTDNAVLEADQLYTYKVTARDAAGNVSPAASVTVKTRCEFFIFCTAEVQ